MVGLGRILSREMRVVRDSALYFVTLSVHGAMRVRQKKHGETELTL
jgi:hypothetical protein